MIDVPGQPQRGFTPHLACVFDGAIDAAMPTDTPGWSGTDWRELHPKDTFGFRSRLVRAASIDCQALDDDALVSEVRRGNQEAFRHITERHGRLLLRLARGVVGSDTEAEDVVQEAFVRAYRKLDAFRGDASLRSWLVSILLNAARNRLRKRSQMVGLEHVAVSALDPFWASRSQAGSGAGDPASLAARAEIRRLLAEAIERLPDAFRAVYRLRELEECSVEETASRLGIKPQTVKTRLHRARRLLRDALDGMLGSMLADTFPFLGKRCASLTAAVMIRVEVEAAVGEEE